MKNVFAEFRDKEQNLPDTADHVTAQQRAEEWEADHPPPIPPTPAHPQDLDIATAIAFYARTVMWNMEEIFMGRTAKTNDLPKRARESRVLNELSRTLKDYVRLHKSYAADKVTERSDDDLKRELFEGFRKLVDGRGTRGVPGESDAGGAPLSEE